VLAVPPPGRTAPVTALSQSPGATAGPYEALGLTSSDGLASSEGLADSPADGATVGIGASVGVGVDDGPQATAERARPMITMTRLSTVKPPCRAFNGSASIVAAATLPARPSPRRCRSMRLAGDPGARLVKPSPATTADRPARRRRTGRRPSPPALRSARSGSCPPAGRDPATAGCHGSPAGHCPRGGRAPQTR
jgi:hypothetical protein